MIEAAGGVVLRTTGSTDSADVVAQADLTLLEVLVVHRPARG